MKTTLLLKASLAAAVALGLSAVPASAKNKEQAKAAKVDDSYGSMGTTGPTSVKVASSKAKYCFTQDVPDGSQKTTCRTKRQWSDKGITVLTD